MRIYFLIVCLTLAQIESSVHMGTKSASQSRFRRNHGDVLENGEEPPVPELERPDIPSFKVKAEPLNQELKFSSHTEEE